MALITVAEAKTLIPSLSGTADDTLLTTLIGQAGVAMARYCGYPGDAPTMESASYTRDLDGNGTREIWLDVWPATAITSVYDDPDLDFAAASLVASGSYSIVDKRRLRLTSTATQGTWTEGTGTVRVTYTAGFATVPDDLKSLCALQVRHMYDRRQTQGKTSVSGGQSNIGLVDPAWLAEEVKQGLMELRLPRSYL